MSTDAFTNPPHHPVGGLFGHWLRRLVHISMLIWPWLYQQYGVTVGGWFNVTAKEALLIILAVVFLLELLRLNFGLVILGQRSHEVRRLSTLAWTAMAVVLVLIIAPITFAYPLIISCGLVDPLLGELRHHKVAKTLIIFLGLISLGLIWAGFSFYFHFSWWWILLMPPITLASEWPNFKWIDDNFLMLVVPLVVVMGVKIFIL